MLSYCLNNNLKSPPANFVKPQVNESCVNPIDQWCSSPQIAQQCGVTQYCIRVKYAAPPLSWPISCKIDNN